MAKTKEELVTQAEALGLNTESLTTVDALKKAIKNAEAKADKEPEAKAEAKQVSLEEAIAEKEAEVKALKAQKLQQELEAKKAERLAALKADKRPTYEAKNGLVYRFKNDTPKTLNVDGAPKKLEDIIKDKEVMAELVAGNSNFVELVN
jgi:hypothetical protein